MSEAIQQQKALYAALSAAQMEMRSAVKDRENPHMRYRYATLDSVVDAVREPLGKHGLCHWSEISTVDGERQCVAVTVNLAHADGGIISTRMEVPLDSEKGLSAVQSAGKAITYMRRYGLMALCGISHADEDDDGASAPKVREPRREEPRAQVHSPAAPAKKDAQEFVAAVIRACADAKNSMEVESARSWARANRDSYELTVDAQMAVKAELEKAAQRFASPIDVPPDVPTMGT